MYHNNTFSRDGEIPEEAMFCDSSMKIDDVSSPEFSLEYSYFVLFDNSLISNTGDMVDFLFKESDDLYFVYLSPTYRTKFNYFGRPCFGVVRFSTNLSGEEVGQLLDADPLVDGAASVSSFVDAAAIVPKSKSWLGYYSSSWDVCVVAFKNRFDAEAFCSRHNSIKFYEKEFLRNILSNSVAILPFVVRLDLEGASRIFKLKAGSA